MGSKTVFFGVLRSLSSLRLEVFGSVQIQTAFYVMLQYGTIWDFSTCSIQMKEKKSFLLSSLFTFIQILRGLTSKILPPSAFIPKRLWNLSSFFRHFYWQNVSTHIAPLQNSLINRVKNSLHSSAVSAIWARWKSHEEEPGRDRENERRSREEPPAQMTYLFLLLPPITFLATQCFVDRIIPANQSVSRNGLAGKSHCEHQNNTIR